jgi:hypothetical protein
MADSGVLDLEAIGGGGGVGTLTLAGLSGGVGSYTPATDPGGPLPGPVDPVLVSNSSPLTLIGSNGDIIPLQLTATDYAALDGASGFGIPPKALTVAEGAGDGGVVRYTRATVRDIDIPVGIFGTSRGEVLDRQRRLASALRVRPGRPPVLLQYTLESGDVYQIPVWYVTGAETQIGADGRGYFCRWVLTLRCPDPFWTSVQETPFLVIAPGATTRGLLPKLARLQLSESSVLGAVEISNPGDVPADLTWEITGPGGPFTATAETGESFTINEIGDGETITVDTRTGAVTDQVGANRYATLGPAPKLFRLPEGTTTVEILLQDATISSRVVGRYRARREVVY